MEQISIKSRHGEYQIIVERGLLDKLDKHLDINRKYVLIHDEQIPTEYVKKVKGVCSKCLDIAFPAGESSKSFEQFDRIIKILQSHNVFRDACIIALGGGVTGDLAGFVASVYLRGIDYIQIPTSLLAQIDASVGGKVAINTELAKNSVGSFYPPKSVLIDPDVLVTLPERHFANGMAEMIKYGMIASKELFSDIQNYKVEKEIDKMIIKALKIKKQFVEADEFDTSIRQALNFGHTYGHAYEAYYGFEKYLHGEAVALGMVIATKNQDTRKALISLLERFNLPTYDDLQIEKLDKYIINDKKNTSKSLNMIIVNEIGKYEIIPFKTN